VSGGPSFQLLDDPSFAPTIKRGVPTMANYTKPKRKPAGGDSFGEEEDLQMFGGEDFEQEFADAEEIQYSKDVRFTTLFV